MCNEKEDEHSVQGQASGKCRCCECTKTWKDGHINWATLIMAADVTLYMVSCMFLVLARRYAPLTDFRSQYPSCARQAGKLADNLRQGLTNAMRCPLLDLLRPTHQQMIIRNPIATLDASMLQWFIQIVVHLAPLLGFSRSRNSHTNKWGRKVSVGVGMGSPEVCPLPTQASGIDIGNVHALMQSGSRGAEGFRQLTPM